MTTVLSIHRERGDVTAVAGSALMEWGGAVAYIVGLATWAGGIGVTVLLWLR